MSNRKCPDCGERLSFDALRCACGWGAKKPDKGARHFDMRCTFESRDRCCYPVAMFTEGNTSGWCIFHRQNLTHFDAAEVVRQSAEVPYAQAIQALIERTKNAPSVVATAWEIAKRHGNRPWRTSGEQLPEVKAA